MNPQVPAPTDRGTWLLVARRDFRVRLRDKGFVISTAITLTVLSILILVRAYGGSSTPSFDLGVVGAPEVTGPSVVQTASQQETEVRLQTFSDMASAEQALRDGRMDAVLESGQLVGKDDVPAPLLQAVRDTATRERIRTALVTAGVPAKRVDALLTEPSIEVRTLEQQDPHRDANAAVAFVGVVLLYGQLFGYGVWVATGVIEEKASRVVEILLATIRPRQLLAGKIAGIGALGIVQLSFIAAFALSLASVTGAIDIPASAIGASLLVLIWFVLGFAFYAGLFAVSGSLVSRSEELQNALVPINLTVIISFFISIGALEAPDTPLAKAASLIPFSSALAMPVRIVLGSATPWEIAASVAISVVSTAALVPLSGRIYAGAILRTGARVKIRDAWRAAV
jgi:ABC-2 type transport system permease protein